MEKSTMQKGLLAGLVIIAAVVLIPYGVLGACGDYLVCLQDNPNNPNACACCVVTPAKPNLTDCPSLTACDKPIGVLINYSVVTLTGSNGNNLIKPLDTSCSSGNVGILAKIVPEAEMNSVNINNVTLQNWANGILFWRVTRGSIRNSTFNDNRNGIYLFNSRANTIISNFIQNNDIGMYLDSNTTSNPHRTQNNNIYNNYFDNDVNTFFNSGTWPNSAPNVWNTTNTSGINILGSAGGGYLGGNYWSGYAETCGCTQAGFCPLPYPVSLPSNIDNLPLCYPVSPFSFSVTPSSISFGSLMPGENYYYNALTISLTSSDNYQITLSPSPSNGKMQSSSPSLTLTTELKIGHSEGSMVPVDEFVTIGPTKNFYETFDLQQETLTSDKEALDYQITLTFTATQVV